MEVTREQLDSLRRDMDERFDSVDHEIASKVSLQVFMWVFGLAWAVVAGIGLLVWQEIKEVRALSFQTYGNVQGLVGEWNTWTKE